MDGGENRGFRASFTGEGQALLKGRVKEKLKELMGDYSDDTLAEYATVLIRNGRNRDEVAKELHVFLGDDNDAFVSWLWGHLSSNLHLYFHPAKTVSGNDGTKSTRSTARGLPDRSLASSMQTNREPEPETPKTARTHQKREWGGIIREQAEPVPLRSVVANVSYAEEKAFHESHAEDKRFHKLHAVRRNHSPDRHNQRKRSREDDERSTKRASRPVMDAPRRLLQFAVRDAVRPARPIMISRSESASKRLRSVVSTLASDSAVDDTHIRLRRANSDLRVPAAARALRAAAEAAEDVLHDNFSGSVFNRLGGTPTINYTGRSLLHREQDSDGDYENIDTAREENEAELRRRNDCGRGDAYMYYRETEEAAGSAPNIDEHDNSSAVRSNGLASRRSTLPPRGGKESLVVGYVRGVAEDRNRRLIAQGTHAVLQPRPSEILNSTANTTTCHATKDSATFALQVPLEKKGNDARKSNVAISHVINDATMTDKAKDSIHSSSMVEAQKASSVAVGSGSTTSQPEGVNDSKTVFVSNVHFGASKDALSRHFNKFGTVLKTLIITDGVTRQPTGSAYIEFLHKESAEQALALNGTSFMSRILKVVRRSSTEVPQQPIWPRASRGSPFASRLIRTAYPRPTFPGAMRGRLPLRGGTRSLQWKREAADSPDAGKSSQVTPATPGNQSVTPITRSFTYTRTEPKPNDGAMV